MAYEHFCNKDGAHWKSSIILVTLIHKNSAEINYLIDKPLWIANTLGEKFIFNFNFWFNPRSKLASNLEYIKYFYEAVGRQGRRIKGWW